jgi:hypothetical protein
MMRMGSSEVVMGDHNNGGATIRGDVGIDADQVAGLGRRHRSDLPRQRRVVP